MIKKQKPVRNIVRSIIIFYVTHLKKVLGGFFRFLVKLDYCKKIILLYRFTGIS